MAKFFTRSLSWLALFSLLIQIVSSPVLVPKAIATTLTTDTITTIGSGPLSVAPDSNLGVLSLDLEETTGVTTLDSIKITIDGSNGFDPNTDLAPLSTTNISGLQVWQENTGDGTLALTGSPDTFLPLSVAPTWTVVTANVKWETTLTLATPVVIPTNNTGSNIGDDFYVVLRAAAGAVAGHQLLVKIETAEDVTLTNTTSVATGISQTISIAAGDVTAPTIPAQPFNYPFSGEVVPGGQTIMISWDPALITDETALASNPIDLELDTGGGFSPLATNLPNTGSYNWNVPSSNYTNAKLRMTVSDLAGNSVYSESSYFNIAIVGGGSDVTAPDILDIFSPSDDIIMVIFSEPIDLWASGQSVNFEITYNNGANILTIYDFGMEYGTMDTVWIKTDTQSNISYELTATDIWDFATTPNTFTGNHNFTGFDNTAPQISTISPYYLPAGATTTVTITGTNTSFDASSFIQIMPPMGFTISNTTVNNDTQIAADITPANTTPAGAYSVEVNYNSGANIARGYNLLEIGSNYNTSDQVNIWNAFIVDNNTVEVDFSEPIDISGATFTVYDDTASANLTVTGAAFTTAFASDAKTVAIDTTGFTNAHQYKLTVDGVTARDSARFVPSGSEFWFFYSTSSMMMPFVSYTFPEDGAWGIALDRNIEINFSEAVDPTTINSTNITVSNGQQTIGGSWSLTNGNTTAIFVPTNNWNSGTTYFIEIGTDIKTTTGFSLDGNLGPGMGHEFSFQTKSSVIGAGPSQWIKGSAPGPGFFDVPKNAKMQIIFGEPVATNSITPSTIKLFKVDKTTFTETNVPYVSATLDSASQRIVTLDFGTLAVPTGGRQSYSLRVFGDIQTADGVAASSTATTEIYRADFEVADQNDTEIPQVKGSYPAHGDIGIEVGTSFLSAFLSKPMDLATINSSTVYATANGSRLTGKVKYNAFEQEIILALDKPLPANRDITFTIISGAAGIKDVANNQLTSNFTATFQTGGADTTSPDVWQTEADPYHLEVNFSENVNTAGVNDSANFSTSAFNPANYSLSVNSTNIDLANASFNYDPMGNRVEIMGLNLAVDNNYQLQINNIADIAGNKMTTANIFNGTVVNILDQGGVIATTDTNFYFDDNRADAWPSSPLAGQTTRYNISFPITKKLTTGDIIRLEFPKGFNLTGAAKDSRDPGNSDINGPGYGTNTFSVTSATTTTAILTFAGDGTNGAISGDQWDYLHLSLKGIINSSIPQDYDTSGYKIEVQTKRGTKTLESITSWPFFITEGGNNDLYIQIQKGGINLAESNLVLYLQAPEIGERAAKSNAAGVVSFTNLPDGYYQVWAEPLVSKDTANTLDDPSDDTTTDYASFWPLPVQISGATSINFSIENTAGVGYYDISGTITETLADDENIVVWAAGKNGQFFEKRYTIDADGNPNNLDSDGDATGDTASWGLKLPDGVWHIGVDPYFPEGTIGPVVAKNWVPPLPQEIRVVGGDVTNVDFTLTSADNTLTVTVQDSSGNKIYNAHVYAYDPEGANQGTYGDTDASGVASLYLANGNYTVGAHIEGMGMIPDQTVTITSSQSLTLAVKQSGVKISGQVLKNTTPVSGAAIFAHQIVSGTDTTPIGEFRDLSSDGNGNYTIKVPENTWWSVESFLPHSGATNPLIVQVESTSLTGQNLRYAPAASGTVSGLLTKGGNGVSGAIIWADPLSATARPNDTTTDSAGDYQMPLVAGDYQLYAYLPEYGDIGNTAITVNNGDTLTENFTVTNTSTVTINLTGAASFDDVFIEAIGTGASADLNNTEYIQNGTSVDLYLPYGTYDIHTNIPGYGDYLESALAVDTATETVNIAVNAALNITGVARNENTLATVGDAIVRVYNTSSGFQAKTITNGSGAFSVRVPANTTYKLQIEKDGYYPSDPQDIIVTTVNANLSDVFLPPKSYINTVSGKVYLGSSTTPAANNAFVWADSTEGHWVGGSVDVNGSYSLQLEGGLEWVIQGAADGYKTSSDNQIRIDLRNSSGSNTYSGQDLTLTTISGYTIKAPKSQTVTPSAGGVVKDTNANLTVTIPPAALGSSASSARLTTKKTTNIPTTPGAQPIGGARQINATDADGNPINNLSQSIQLEICYGDEITAGTLTSAQAATLTLGYWDQITQAWTSIPAVNNTNSQCLTGSTDHLSLFSAILSVFSPPSSSPASSLSSPSSSSSSGNTGGGSTRSGSSSDTSGLSGLMNLIENTAEAVVTAQQRAAKSIAAGMTSVVQRIAVEDGKSIEDVVLFYRDGQRMSLADMMDDDNFLGDVSREFNAAILKLATGDRIATSDGRASFSLSRYSDVRLDHQSDITIDDFSADKVDEQVQNVHIKYQHNAGQAWYKFQQHTEENAAYEIATASMVATIRGTSVNVDQKANGIETISLIEGKMDITDTTTGEVISLSPGQSATHYPDGSLEIKNNARDFLSNIWISFNTKMDQRFTEFDDLPQTHWAHPFVKTLRQLGIIKGRTENSFAPNNPITRAEILKVALLGRGVTINQNTRNDRFTDIPATHWIQPYITSGVDLGMIKGYNDGTFRPDAFVTRAEALKILLSIRGFDPDFVDLNAISFSDVSRKSWYAIYIAQAVTDEIVSGYDNGIFRPDAPATRAEVAKMAVLAMK